jgi:hypothetical protein
MKKAPWELIFLLLTSQGDKKTLQALLESAQRRSEAFDGIPDYRKIKERDLVL